ncbi:MAG: HAD family hydrolase [Polyangiales bacterium]
MHPARPQLPSERCPACGQAVDPLRAGRIVLLEDGTRFLCGEECRIRFLLGERGFDAPRRKPSERPSVDRPSIPDMVREATVAREQLVAGGGDTARSGQNDSIVAAGLAILAATILALTPSPELGWLAALLLVACAAVNARIELTTIRANRSLEIVAPLGILFATVAAVTAGDAEAQRWSLAGAVAASIVVSARNWLHASFYTPVRMAADELRGTLPTDARVPTGDASAYEEVPASGLRQGDLLVVLEGERAPADGVIEEGSASALRYPRAAHARPYAEGDFILAGTRVLEGAITVRVRRTGPERGVVRAIELGRRKQQDRAAASRLRFFVAHWSWLLLAPATAGGLFWGGPGAAAALLLGTPVLALLASLDAPLDSGALASARRGMFFGSSRAFRDAGRASTTAILLRGSLTAGEPIVRQAHAIGGTNLERTLAIAAAAEQAADDHPIARAIQQYAEEHCRVTATVRKERVRPGLGVSAVTAHGVPVVVGRRQLLLDEGISVAGADSDAAHIENEGLTPIFIAVDGQLQAMLAVHDPTHVGARDAVQRIADLPCEAVVLSGDDRRTVERIAANLGAPKVKAPLLPRERVAEVRALRETGGVTVTIGRGGEDDAVLAAADVPVSLRLVGSALDDRGVVIASQDIRDAAGALWVARAARRATWRGIGACLAATVFVILGVAFTWMTPFVAALCGIATEGWTLRAGSRLLRRVDLRVPMQQ